MKSWRLLGGAGCALCLVVASGCYDSTALVEEVRATALRGQTHEIEIGKFLTTMPRDPNSGGFTELQLHLFGTVAQHRIPTIEKQLKADGFRLRAETLVAIRKTTSEELAEPNLGHLRERLMKVANNVLEGAPITSIGVEKIRIVDK